MDGMQPEEQRLRAYIDNVLREQSERLLPEPKLSELLDIPRGRLRSHLKRLEKDGLIWRHVGKGTFIGQRTAQVVDSAPVASVSPSHAMEGRLLVEPLLAGKAAVHARRSDLEAMERCLDETPATTSYAAWKSGDDRLHRTIAEAAQNPLLLTLHDVVHGLPHGALERTGIELVPAFARVEKLQHGIAAAKVQYQSSPRPFDVRVLFAAGAAHDRRDACFGSDVLRYCGERDGFAAACDKVFGKRDHLDHPLVGLAGILAVGDDAVLAETETVAGLVAFENFNRGFR